MLAAAAWSMNSSDDHGTGNFVCPKCGSGAPSSRIVIDQRLSALNGSSAGCFDDCASASRRLIVSSYSTNTS
jgi:hypothetical protein